MDAREIHRDEAGYPGPLAAVADAPASLWVRGRLPAGRAVAVVGARGARPESLATARAVGAGLAQRGIAVGSGGCDALVGEAALAARSSSDILARIDGLPAAAPPLPDDPRAARLYDALDATPRDLSDVAARAGLRPDEALALAIDLELGGLA